MRRFRGYFIALLLLAVGCGLAGCRKTNRIVRIHTVLGDMRVRLYDTTPRHRDNFIQLVEDGYFDSLLFHRVVRDFMIQGGDPDSRHAPPGTLLGLGGPGYELPAEIGAPHIRGALAAARLPDGRNPARLSNGSQFFIVHGRAQSLASLAEVEERLGKPIESGLRARYLRDGGAPQLDGLYTVFGELIEGWDVLDKIAAVPRDANDRPLEDIRMRCKVER